MGAHGITLCEEGHFVTLIAPQSQSAALTSEVFSMENYSHATIIVQGGAGSSTTITVSECDDFTPTTAATKTFSYAQETTADGDTATALAAATTAGVALGTATGIFTIIEIDDTELTDGYPCIQINLSDPGTSKLVSAFAILTGPRFGEDITQTAIS